MGRSKKEGGAVIKSFTLSEKEVELMEFDKAREGFRSNSEYIGWLIRTRNFQTNPAEYLKDLEREEEKLESQVKTIQTKRKAAIKNLELNKEIELVKLKKRPEAVKIIQRKIIDEGIFGAEQYAKSWAIMLNCTPTELLFEAIKNIKRIKGAEDERNLL